MIEKTQKESELESQVMRYLEQYSKGKEVCFWKVKAGGQLHSFGTKRIFKKSTIPGFPDILICLQGKLLGVELKTKIGKQSEIQKECQEKIEKARGLYFICRSLEELELILNKVNS